jgi:hypothetical protein
MTYKIFIRNISLLMQEVQNYSGNERINIVGFRVTYVGLAEKP